MSGSKVISKDVLKDGLKDGNKKWKTSSDQIHNPTQTCHIKPQPLGTLPPPWLERLNIEEGGEKGGEGGEGQHKRTFDNDYGDPSGKHVNYPWGDLTNLDF